VSRGQIQNLSVFRNEKSLKSTEQEQKCFSEGIVYAKTTAPSARTN